MAEPLVISDLRGGLNTEDPTFALPNDQVVLCENMDMTRSTLGGRRLGHSVVTGPNSAYDTYFLHRHLPTSDETAATLWAVVVSGTTSIFSYKDTSWHTVTPTGTEALDAAQGKYRIRAQSLHGKLFLAYPTISGTDRLHVYDGTSIRKVGLAEPAAPNVANQGSGSYSTTRYFRVRYTEQVGGVTVRRSEPSDATTFAPNGTSLSARVTKPAAINEGETHWEVEESIDGTLFYRIATVAVGTTTYDDSLAATAVSTTGTLSEDIGDYSLPWNPKFLSADQDRLLFAGSWEQPALASRIGWTPVFGASGVGNDERYEDDTDPYLDLDGYDGGELTDFAGPMSGYHFAYKRKRIYKIVRTYARAQAYQAVPLTDTFGAIPGSVVKGLDEAGRPCQYFLDYDLGPARNGANGVERCGADIHPTWLTVNRDAALVAHGLFYPDSMTVAWDVATGSDETPSLRIKLAIENAGVGPKGTRRGWGTDTGPYMATLCSALFADNIEDNTTRSVTLKPVYGTAIAGAKILMGETGTTDNDLPYQARVRTKPYMPAGLLGGFAVRKVAVLAEASEADLAITLTRDHGTETRQTSVSLRPQGSETSVFVDTEGANLAELRAVQVEYGDSGPAEADWVVEAIALLPEDGQRQ